MALRASQVGVRTREREGCFIVRKNNLLPLCSGVAQFARGWLSGCRVIWTGGLVVIREVAAGAVRWDSTVIAAHMTGSAGDVGMGSG